MFESSSEALLPSDATARTARSGIVICRSSRVEDEGSNGVRNEFEFDGAIETAGHAVQQQPGGAFLVDREPRAGESFEVATAPPIGAETGAGERTEMVEPRISPRLAAK